MCTTKMVLATAATTKPKMNAKDQFYLSRVGMSTRAKTNIAAMFAELVVTPELFDKPYYWRARVPVFWIDPSMWPMKIVVQPR